MKNTILITVFVVSALGMSEATDHMVDYYATFYNDDDVYIALLIGTMLSYVLDYNHCK